MKALVALSGGVDSSLAAALMVEQGHEVIGITLQLWPGGAAPAHPIGGDAEQAGRLAGQLGIPHFVVDRTTEFRRAVVEPFADAYRAGLTPNPCVECNRRVRFAALLEEADRLECPVLVTGHYARIASSPGSYHLLRAAEPAKDQSYFLYRLGRRELARLAFPVGEMGKEEVRRRARALGLRTAEEVESQDLCFVGRGGYRSFLREHFPEVLRPGPVVDTAGQELARHEGVAGFTLGQRRGLGVAAGEARYVVAIDPAMATVVVGDATDCLATGCRVGEVSWVAGSPPEGGGLEVKVRYRSPSVPARLEPVGVGEWVVWFEQPRAAVTPGQAAVLYRGDEVVGGGTILGALRRWPGSHR